MHHLYSFQGIYCLILFIGVYKYVIDYGIYIYKHAQCPTLDLSYLFEVEKLIYTIRSKRIFGKRNVSILIYPYK